MSSPKFAHPTNTRGWSVSAAAVEVERLLFRGLRYVVDASAQVGDVREMLLHRDWTSVTTGEMSRTWTVLGLRADGSPDGATFSTQDGVAAREMYERSLVEARLRLHGGEVPGRKAKLVLDEIPFGRRGAR